MLSKSYKKNYKSFKNTTRDFNKIDRREVRDKLKHGVYEDLPSDKNHSRKEKLGE